MNDIPFTYGQYVNQSRNTSVPPVQSVGYSYRGIPPALRVRSIPDLVPLDASPTCPGPTHNSCPQPEKHSNQHRPRRHLQKSELGLIKNACRSLRVTRRPVKWSITYPVSELRVVGKLIKIEGAAVIEQVTGKAFRQIFA